MKKATFDIERAARDDYYTALTRLDNILASIARLHQQIKETEEENRLLCGGMQEAQELFETVRASHDWTERRNTWLEKYGDKSD